jgi:hypothetical protein
MLRAWMLGLLGLVLATGAAAAPTGQVPTDGKEIVVPFDPGVGTVARFDLVSTDIETEDGKVQPAVTTRVTEQLRFLERNGTGYVVEYTSHNPRIEGPEEQVRLMQMIVDSIGVLPVKVQLDPTGKPVDVLNLAEVNRTLDRVWDLLAAELTDKVKKAGATPEVVAEVQTMMAGMSAPYRNMTAEVAIEQLLTSLHLVSGWGGSRFVQGETIPFRQTVQMQLLQADVDMMGTIDLVTHVPGGSATVKTRLAAEPKALQAAVQAFAARLSREMAGNLTGEKKAEFEKGLAEAVAELGRMRLEEESLMTLSLSTGLAQSNERLARRGVPGVKDTESRQKIVLLP